MYSKCKCVASARGEFDAMSERNIISWNSMIAGYARNGYSIEAFQLFQDMQCKGIRPDRVTFTSLLNAFGRPEALSLGKQVHAYVIHAKMETDIVVATALVTMYGKCGSIVDARNVFRKILSHTLISWNSLVTAYVRTGFEEEAFKSFQIMQIQGVKPDKITFISILSACRGPESISQNKLVHAHIIYSKYDSDTVVGNALVSAYVRCRNIESARRTFDMIVEQDVISWTAIITGYVYQGHLEQAFKLFQKMLSNDFTPNKITFITLLNACTSPKALALGKLVHACIIDSGKELDVILDNALLTMYWKCESIMDTWKIFSRMPERDKVSWNAMIAGVAHCGYVKEAFDLLLQMQKEGFMPDNVTFISILSTFFKSEVLTRGKLVHALTIEKGFELNVIVGTALVNMYIRCGSFEEACRIFNSMPERNVVSWNTMISGYAQYGSGERAFELFMQMQQEGVKLSRITFINILNACASLKSLALGKLVHSYIIRSEVEQDVVMSNALLSMYIKCGSIEDADRTFSMMQEGDIVSWNIMIGGYAEQGYDKESLRMFNQMQQEGFEPNEITFINILNLCTGPEFLGLGKLVHTSIEDNAFELDVGVGNALISMYGRCGNIEGAERCFNDMVVRDVISWNALIAAYANNLCAKEALHVFQQMQWNGMKPDKVTLINMLDSCSIHPVLAQGKLIHAYIVDNGYDRDIMVGNSLVSMYSKCDHIDDAKRIFSSMPERDVVSWNALIAGLAQHGHGELALEMFQEMQQADVIPDLFTFVSIIDACTSSVALRQGKLVHSYIIDSKMQLDVVIGSALITMYSRCGSLGEAERVFSEMPERNVVSWNAIIAGYAQHGHWKEALRLLGKMQIEGYDPDDITLVSVLFAYSHSGFTDDAYHFFTSIQEFGVMPTVEHYNCMVDLLGRAGQLDEAGHLINMMPIKCNSVTWMAMIGSCRLHGFIECGKQVTECALQLDPQLSPTYVALSNLSASTSKERFFRTQSFMGVTAVTKGSGRSCGRCYMAR